MKTIRICEKPEAYDLYRNGLFHSFVGEYLDKYPRHKRDIIELKAFKVNTGCSFSEAVHCLDGRSEQAFLEYSDDGAILCGGREEPKLMRKIGNVWVPVGTYSKNETEYDLFDEPYLRPFPKPSVLNAKNMTLKQSIELADSLFEGSFYRISRDEIWHKASRYTINVYTAGTFDVRTLWIRSETHEFCRYLNSRRKKEYGEF